MYKSVLSIRITSFYGSQPSFVFFSCKTATFGAELQVSIGPRPHPSSWACKTAWFAPEWQVYMGSSPYLCFFFSIQNSDLWIRITSLYVSQAWPVILCMNYTVLNIRNTSLYGSHPLSEVFAFKPPWLASELLVSMVPRPHDWFLDAKQRLLDCNNKSLRVPNITCRFVHAKQLD